jgi:hypothetical protein
VPSPIQITKSIAALYKRLGYRVSNIIRDPEAMERPYLFYVDNGELMDRDGLPLPTAVRLFPSTRDVKFDGFLASELEKLLEHVATNEPPRRLAR